MSNNDQDVMSFKELLTLLMKKNNIKKKKLAEELDVDPRTIRNIQGIKEKPGKLQAIMLGRIADRLELSDPSVREWFLRSPYDVDAREKLDAYVLSEAHHIHRDSLPPIAHLVFRIRDFIGLERKDVAKTKQEQLALSNLEEGRTQTIKPENSKEFAKRLRLHEDLYEKFLEVVRRKRREEKKENAEESREIEKLWSAVYKQGQYYALPSTPSIPPVTERLYGRKELGGQIIDALQVDVAQQKAVCLYGPQGIGRTALALEIARRNRRRFPGGQVWVSLLGCEGGIAVKRAILEPFYNKQKGKEDGAIWLGKLVKQAEQANGEIARIDDVLNRTLKDELLEPCLLIIDDVLTNHIETVKEIVGGNKFCRVRFIVISDCDVLQNIGAWSFIIPPLSSRVAVAMLSKGVTAHVSTGSHSVFTKLALELYYYPPSLLLAREILRSNEETPNSLLLKLQGDRSSILVDESKNQENSLKTLVEQSAARKGFENLLSFVYERLSQDTQRGFRQLSVFAETPTAIPLKALHAVWRSPNGNSLSLKEVHELCKILEKAGLIRMDKEDQGCKLHSLVLRFTRAKMKKDATPDEDLQTVLRHADYYGRLIANVDPTLPESYLHFSREKTNVAQARTNLIDLIAQASRTPTETNLAKFAEHTTYFESMSPSTALWRRDLLVKSLDDVNATSISWLMLHLGNTYVLMANSRTRVLFYYDAIACYKTIVNFAQGSTKSATGAERYSRACAAAYIGLGSCYALLSDLAQDDPTDDMINVAIRYLEEGEDTARLHHDRELMFYALCSLGDIYLKKYDQAKHEETNADRLFANAYFQQAQSFALKDLRLQAILERKLGDSCLVANDPSMAIQHYQSSRRIAEQIDDFLAIYHLYVKEATACQQEGKDQEAERLYQKAAILQAKLFLPDALPIVQKDR